MKNKNKIEGKKYSNISGTGNEIEENNSDTGINSILDRIKISINVSDIADKLKDEILADINEKIDRHNKIIRIRRISLAAASIAAIFILSFFLRIITTDKSVEQLIAISESYKIEEAKEVSIVSGDDKREIEENKKITHTKEGNIVVDEEERIVAEEIETEYVTIIVPKGKRTSIQFSDGSTAWINSGSKLVFPKNFQKKSRNIYIDGEIYIEVAKDEKRPFYVNAERINVAVLGTIFNINAYKDEPTTSVILVEGSVEVKNNKQKNTLKPGQGYFTESDNISIKAVDTYSYTCWKDGRLKLVDEPFEALLRRLSRYYGVEIHPDNDLKDFRFEGNLDLRDSIEGILNILTSSKAFTYVKKDNVIEVRNK